MIFCRQIVWKETTKQEPWQRKMAQSQNMKLRRFRSRREFKKYLILAPPGQMYQLVFRIARTGQKQFYYLTENTFCSQQSILLRSTSCTFCTLYERILFRLNKKTSYTLYRLETSDDLQVALGRIPQYKIKPEKVFHCSRVLDIIFLLFHLFYKKNIAFISSSSLKMLPILYPVR